MRKNYKTIYLGGVDEIVEKKSRFIATIEPVQTEEEALTFIEKKKKEYWNARHHCFAYIIGESNPLMRCSDDGEPSGTAGKPMLEVISGSGLCNVCVVVTRYFGGVLLGTGGLVRAYSKAVQAGLTKCISIEKQSAWEFEITCDYTWVGKLQYLVAQMGIYIIETQYTQEACMKILVPLIDKEKFLKQVTELSSAKISPIPLRELYFAKVEKEIILFED